MFLLMRSRKGALSLDKKHRCLSFDGDCSNLGGSSQQWTCVRLCEHLWIEHVLLSFATADPNGITTWSIGLIPEPLHSGQTVALHYWLPILCWFPSSFEASPMAAPNLHVANCPACEMVSHVKTWSKDLGPSGAGWKWCTLWVDGEIWEIFETYWDDLK